MTIYPPFHLLCVPTVLHILSARNALGDIVSNTLVTSTSANSDKHRSLAKAVWKKVQNNMQQEDFTESTFFEALTSCKAEFRTMKNNARVYLEQEAVKAFLRSNHNSEYWASRGETAVNQVWNPQDRIIRVSHWSHVHIPANILNLKPYQLLLDGNFDRLLQIHRFYSSNAGSDSVSHLHLA